MMMMMTKKSSFRGVFLIMMMTMLIFSCVVPISAAEKKEEADSPSESSSSKSKSDKKDSKDEDASATVKEICKAMVKPAECEEFLANSPKADPTHMVKFNLRVLKTLVEEGTYISTKDQFKNPSTPEKMKKSLETCVKNYNKTIDGLDAAADACRDCEEEASSGKEKKCKPKHVETVTSSLKEAVKNFKKCTAALEDAGTPPKPWIKSLNEAMIDGALFLSQVASKIKSDSN